MRAWYPRKYGGTPQELRLQARFDKAASVFLKWRGTTIKYLGDIHVGFYPAGERSVCERSAVCRLVCGTGAKARVLCRLRKRATLR